MTNDVLLNGGYGETESLLGKNETERATSTAYKMVYKSSGNNQSNSYGLAENVKGDAIWEISNNRLGTSWFNSVTRYPFSYNPFFLRSGYFHQHYGIFTFKELKEVVKVIL